jgi:hypothetical protein
MAIDILARKLSISFHILPYGEARWWLTRESGRCPLCRRTFCSRCAKNEKLHDMRQSYLVIVADHPGEPVWTEPARRVAFAQLNADALSIAACRIAPAILGLDAKQRLRALQRLFRAFAKGIFSTSITCVCNIQVGACSSCSSGGQARFLWENGYSRVLPFGKAHWYSGVSDAVDNEESNNRWLQCH